MKTLKTALIASALLASFVGSGSAKSIWDQINELAPLAPVFETLRNNAP